MTRSFTSLASILCAVAGTVLAALPLGSEAQARGKDYFSQTYQFKKPMHGYSGHSGNYYCDYQRLPNKTCKGGRCKITSWTLRQHCY